MLMTSSINDMLPFFLNDHSQFKVYFHESIQILIEKDWV